MTYCDYCGNTGEIEIDGHIVTCPVCDPDGEYFLTPEARWLMEHCKRIYEAFKRHD